MKNSRIFAKMREFFMMLFLFHYVASPGQEDGNRGEDHPIHHGYDQGMRSINQDTMGLTCLVGQEERRCSDGLKLA
jgi:hypothetical protein